MTRVLLFEDNRNFREALKDAFSYSKKVCLSQAFENADRAIVKIKEYDPDVVIMDIEMPGKSGLDALSEIREAGLNTKVMILTQFADEHRVFVALCRGALGYALKNDPLEAIEEAVVNVHQGGGYFSPPIAGKVASFFQHSIVQKSPEYIALTPRETEVLQYLAKALKYQEIAKKMFLSYSGVHSHIKNIYQKLHVSSRSEAIIKAIESKLV